MLVALPGTVLSGTVTNTRLHVDLPCVPIEWNMLPAYTSTRT